MSRIETMSNKAWFSKTEKLRPEQIAQRSTWGRVPDMDMKKAAQHVIRVVPKDGYTVTEMFELDPGISGQTVGEGRGWQFAPAGYGQIMIHGRAMR